MQVPVWLLFVDVMLWALIFLLQGIRFEGPLLSPFELKRRMESGDRDALKQGDQLRILPRLLALRQIIQAVLLVIVTALTIALFGWIIGTVVASVLSLLMGMAARLEPLARLSRRLFTPYEPKLHELVNEWSWLEWFRGLAAKERDTIATSKAELSYIIERSAAVLSRDELLRFQASLALDSHSVEDIMTPVSVVDTADVTDALGPLVLDNFYKTGHSRFPVIEGDIHHVVGVLYLHDIINLKSAKSTVREAMDPQVHYIHEKQSLEHALHGFLKTHRHLFIVVNDYRETVGVLTLEDVLETLLGKKIVDEFDQYEDLRAVAESNPRRNNLPKGKTDI